MDAVILILTLLAGCLMPVQPAVNAVTAQWMQSPYLASFFSFLTGTMALGLICVALRLPWRGHAALHHHLLHHHLVAHRTLPDLLLHLIFSAKIHHIKHQ